MIFVLLLLLVIYYFIIISLLIFFFVCCDLWVIIYNTLQSSSYLGPSTNGSFRSYLLIGVFMQTIPISKKEPSCGQSVDDQCLLASYSYSGPYYLFVFTYFLRGCLLLWVVCVCLLVVVCTKRRRTYVYTTNVVCPKIQIP